MAASRLPILDAAPSLDELPPLAPNLEPVPFSTLLRDINARIVADRAAERFVRTPGPAERAQFIAQVIGQQPEGL